MSLYALTGGSPIATAFQKIATKTQLTQSDADALARHQGRIESSISVAFAVSKFVRIGSVVRGTALTGSSDLDLLAVLRRDDVYWGGSPKAPSTVLSNLRSALQNTFPTTEVGRDGQAIVINFSDGKSVDVVPGWWHSALDTGWPLYAIPSGGSEWLLTGPDSHAKYIANGDDASGGKLKSVVRIVKYLMRSRSPALPFSGFHLELLLTQEGTCRGARAFAACVADALALLDRRGCRALQDPCGISGLIPAATTDAKRERLLQGVSAAASYASTAVRCEATGDVANAMYYWRLAFNGQFS